MSLVRVGDTLQVRKGETALLSGAAIADLDLDENLYTVVAEGTALRLYVNGALNKEATVAEGLAVGSTWQLARGAEGLRVDAVEVYAQALTAEQLTALVATYPQKQGEFLALPEIALPESWGAAYDVPKVAHHFASTGDSGMASEQPLFRTLQRAGTDAAWLVGIRKEQNSSKSVSGGYPYNAKTGSTPSICLVSVGGKAADLTAGHVNSRQNNTSPKDFKGDAILVVDGTAVSRCLSSAGYAFPNGGTRGPVFEGNTLVEVCGKTTAPHMAGGFALRSETKDNVCEFKDGLSTIRVRTVMSAGRIVGGSYGAEFVSPFRHNGASRAEILIPETEGMFAASVYGGSYNNHSSGDASLAAVTGAASVLLDAPKVTFTGKVIAGNGGKALTQSNATATLTVKAAKFDGATVLPYEGCVGEATSTLEILGVTDLSNAATLGDFTHLTLGADLSLGTHRLPNTTLAAPTAPVTLTFTTIDQELQDAKVTLCKASFSEPPATLTVAPARQGWELLVEEGALVYKRTNATQTHTWTDGDLASWFEDWGDGDSASFEAHEGGRTITLDGEIFADAITLSGENTFVGVGSIRAKTLTFGKITLDLSEGDIALGAEEVHGEEVAVALPEEGLTSPLALLEIPQQTELTFTFPEGDTSHFVYYADGWYWVANLTAFAQPFKATVSKTADWTALTWKTNDGAAIPVELWEKTGDAFKPNAELTFAGGYTLTTASPVTLESLTAMTKSSGCTINTDKLTVDYLTLRVSDGGSSGTFRSNGMVVGKGAHPRVLKLMTIGENVVYTLDPASTNVYTFSGNITGEGTLEKRAASATVILEGALRNIARFEYNTSHPGKVICNQGGAVKTLRLPANGATLELAAGKTLVVTEKLELNNAPTLQGEGALELADGAAFTVAGTGNTLKVSGNAKLAIAEGATVAVSGNGIAATRTAPLISCSAPDEKVAERFTFGGQPYYVAAEAGGYMLKAYPTPATTPEGLPAERQLAIWKAARDAGLEPGYALTVAHSKASVADVLACFDLPPVADKEAEAVSFVCDFGIAAMRCEDPAGKAYDVKVVLRNGALLPGARLVLQLNGEAVEAELLAKARDAEDTAADVVQWFRVTVGDAALNKLSVKATTAPAAE